MQPHHPGNSPLAPCGGLGWLVSWWNQSNLLHGALAPITFGALCPEWTVVVAHAGQRGRYRWKGQGLNQNVSHAHYARKRNTHIQHTTHNTHNTHNNTQHTTHTHNTHTTQHTRARGGELLWLVLRHALVVVSCSCCTCNDINAQS